MSAHEILAKRERNITTEQKRQTHKLEYKAARFGATREPRGQEYHGTKDCSHRGRIYYILKSKGK